MEIEAHCTAAADERAAIIHEQKNPSHSQTCKKPQQPARHWWIDTGRRSNWRISHTQPSTVDGRAIATDVEQQSITDGQATIHGEPQKIDQDWQGAELQPSYQRKDARAAWQPVVQLSEVAVNYRNLTKNWISNQYESYLKTTNNDLCLFIFSDTK